MSSTPKDTDEGWGNASRALFRAARSEHAPSVAARERVRRALAQRLQQAPHVPVSVSSARPWSAALSRLLKLGVGVTLLVAVGLAVKRYNGTRTSQLKPHAVPAVVPMEPNTDAHRGPSVDPGSESELVRATSPLNPVPARWTSGLGTGLCKADP